jgi:nicotinate-nucleotide pyrophosphorylase (carboxylating)
MSLQTLIPKITYDIIKDWLKEDIPNFDIGGYVVGNKFGKSVLLGKSEGILAGVPFFSKVFEYLDCEIEWLKQEGSSIAPVEELAFVTGKINNILQGERLALNILTKTSGIATQAKKMTLLAEKHGFKGKISGTRKTTPGFRLFEKYALLVGGADTHRMDLSSMIMLKDNHINCVGDITNAIKKTRDVASTWYKIEVECQNLSQAEEAIKAGADIIMLDNFNPSLAKETAKLLKEKYTNQRFTLEVSGGISKETVIEYFSPHIDIISMGSLITNYRPLDFSLKIKKLPENK